MPLPGNLLTTAMAVMPHKDPEKALETAMSLDVPFWPQLPNLSYYEDMYVQASEHFPGIVLDMENRTLGFSMDKFIEEYETTLEHWDEPEYFDISDEYSVVYNRFLELDLSDKPAIRGQLEGPISFGLNVLDENKRPILFSDEIRPLMLEIMAKRVNIQLTRLKERNENAFMFIDEPGLQFLFSGLSGYSDMAAKKDLDVFFEMIERPRGIHLCGNPDWDFLLSLDLDVLSLDVFSNGEVFTSYISSIQKFLDRGGTLVWGIVPTETEPFNQEGLDSLKARFIDLWDHLGMKGIDLELLLSRSMLSPATCCLINGDGDKTVEEAFEVTKKLALLLRENYGILS